MIGEKIKYFLRSLASQSQAKNCPNCHGDKLYIVDKKYWVTTLFKCASCKLNFRWPVDSKNFLNDFYQMDYHASYSDQTEDITEVPSEAVLRQMMENNFYGKRDYSPFVNAVKRIPARVVDFGSSWGYSVFQLNRAGNHAVGFELSRARAALGKKIGVDIFFDPTAVPDNNDVILSSHTIEHLAVVHDLVDFCRRKLTADGVFICFCPNGSPEFRKRNRHGFHVNWGFLHPNYLDIEFAVETFKKNPYLILTNDWRYDFSVIEAWDGISQSIGDKRDGEELLIITKPNVTV